MVLQEASDFKPQFLLLLGDTIKLEANQSPPADIVIKVQAWVADVTGMEELFHHHLHKSMPYQGLLLVEGCF